MIPRCPDCDGALRLQAHVDTITIYSCLVCDRQTRARSHGLLRPCPICGLPYDADHAWCRAQAEAEGGA